MIEKYCVRTDLALEQKERFESDHVEIQGVALEEEYDEEKEMKVTTVKIETENGAKIMTKGIYLCPKCNEFINNNIYFLLDNFTETPFGTVRYDVVFPFGNPVCDICNSDLVYIDNICSSKVKCPKCDSALNARKIG